MSVSKNNLIQSDSTEKLAKKRRKISRVSAVSIEDVELQPSLQSVCTQPCGVIEKVILRNVMCHEYFDFEFTPQVNLLQGVNGSGKSTVVAAIIAGLGGSSKATDRAKNLISLIKTGSNWATIEIHLKNDGFSPYKPEIFGEKVIVERRMTTSGNNTYKIKSGKGRVVFEKKEELVKILNWWNFQVDNPVTILSQERAKTFLSSTNPNTMFDFFMTATQLKQCRKLHEETSNNCNISKKLWRYKKESLAVLESEVKELAKKVEAINSIEEKRKFISSLRQSIYWAKVIEDENEIEEKKKEVEVVGNKLSKINERLKQGKDEEEKLSEDHRNSDKMVVQIFNKSKLLEKELQTATRKYTEAKQHTRQLKSAKNHLEKEIFEKERDISILSEKLQNDTTEDQVAWETTVTQLNAEKAKLDRMIGMLEENFKVETGRMHTLAEQLEVAENDHRHHQLEERGIINRLNELKTQLKSLKGSTNNLTVFGQYMPRLMKEIDAAAGKGLFKIKPIGPVGIYMKVKKPEWIHIVEEITKNLLTSFLVSCFEDSKYLTQIFKRVIPLDEKKPSIIKMAFRPKIHDVSRFETRSQYFTSMWSIIETDNIQVANALLDQLNIESLLLVPTADEANDLLIEKSRVPKNCRKALTLNGDTYFPDPNFRVYSGRGKTAVKYLQVSLQERVRDLTSNIKSTEAEVDECQKETKEKKITYEKALANQNKSLQKQREYKEALQRCKQQLQELKNQEIPPPPDVDQLQSDLQKIQQEKDDLEKRKEELQKDILKASTNMKTTENNWNAVTKESENIGAKANEYKKTTNDIEIKLIRCRKQMTLLEKNKEKCESDHKTSVKELERLSKQLETTIKDVTELYPERIVPQKSRTELVRELEAYNKAINLEENHHGNLKEITRNWKEKMQKYVAIKKEVFSQDKFLNALQESLSLRMKMMDTSQALLSAIVTGIFKDKIKMRNLAGYVEIDFKAKTLQILMGKNTGKEKNQLHSIQMMSGGERSFATVCFILAIWHFVSSPIRIMDEFDIFMDVVSRNQCVDMILNEVKPNVQYIMVSPQDYNTKAPNLHIFRMPAPERRGNENDASEEI